MLRTSRSLLLVGIGLGFGGCLLPPATIVGSTAGHSSETGTSSSNSGSGTRGSSSGGAGSSSGGASSGASSSSAAGSSGGGSSSGATSTSGEDVDAGSTGPCGQVPSGPYITVTLEQTGIHPAEVAALAARGVTPGSIVGQQVAIQGVAICSAGPTYTTLATATLTAQNQNGPLVFPNLAVGGVNLGLIATYSGFAVPAPTCAQLTADGGYQDMPAPTANEVFVGIPTADIDVPAAFTITWDYATLLDCAQGQKPGTLLGAGFALLYASAPDFALDGGMAGVTFETAPAVGNLGYYAANYAGKATGQTSTNGVATFSGADYSLITVSASATGDTFASHELAALPQTCYEEYFVPQ